MEQRASVREGAPIPLELETASAILEGLADGVLVLDRECRVTYLNAEAERVLGRTRTALLGQSLWRELPGLEQTPFGQGCLRALASRAEVRVTGDGSPFGARFELRARPLRDGLVLHLRDFEGAIGERVEQSEPGHAERERAELLARAESARNDAEAAREHLHRLFMEAPAMIAVTRGPEHVFELANKPYQALLGGRELTGKSAREALPELSEQGYFDLLDRTFQSGEPFRGSEMLSRIRRGDAYEEYYFDFVYQPYRGPDGEVQGILAFASDVTEQVRARKRIEDLLAELSQQTRVLRTLTDNADAALFLMDVEQRCTFMNPAAEKMTGFTLEEVRASQKPLHDLIHHLHPDGRPYPMAECPIDRALPTRAREQGEDVFIHKSGRFYPVAFTASPILIDGKPVGTVIEVRDTTLEKEAAAERERLLLSANTLLEERGLLLLRETRARRDAEAQRAMLDLIIDQIGEGIVVADEHGIVRVFNPAAARQHGISKQEVAAPEWSEAYGLLRLDKTPMPAHESPLFRAVLGEVSSEARWLVRRPDGQVRTLVGTATPLRRADGTSAGGVLISRDETARLQEERERERLIQALESSNEELDKFAYVASHDLKAPLRGIASLAQWIEDDLGELLRGETREHMDLLRGRVRRLEALIQGILDYSRAGRVRTEPEPVDLSALLADTVELLAPPVGVAVDLEVEVAPLALERVPLQQVFMNLIGNALKYVPEQGGRVRVLAHEDALMIHLRVSDNGPGIASEHHARIWRIFQRLESRDQLEGTGIGLSIVKKVVESRGGQVWVESELGQGATFHVLWPKRGSDHQAGLV